MTCIKLYYFILVPTSIESEQKDQSSTDTLSGKCTILEVLHVCT